MVACLVCDPASRPAPGVLEAVARASSPRVEPHGDTAVIFDVDGLARVCGPPDVVAREVMALAAAEGVRVRVALAATRTTAWILAHARPGTTVVPSGTDRAALAGLSIGWLGVVCELDGTTSNPDEGTLRFRRGHGPRRKASGRSRHFRVAPSPARLAPADHGGDTRRSTLPGATPTAVLAMQQQVEAYRRCLATFERWGIGTIGAVAVLPRGDVHARMGPVGVRLHQAACGEDAAPLVPRDPAVPFVDRLQLDWPIEGLEPLAFVLSRQFERLSAALEQADRGAVTVTTRLVLVTREVHERVLHLPAPLRDARVLRTLVGLDLESHPPPAGIDVVEIELGVTPGRIVQGSLLARSLPSPEDLTTLLARLGALMGESRIGVPAVLDTYDERAVAMMPFRVERPGPGTPGPQDAGPQDLGPEDLQDLQNHPILRRFRLPIAARVAVEHGRPVRVTASARGLAGGAVVECAGPWRSSGAWWALEGSGWDRDAWDLALADGGVYRVTRNRLTGTWDIEGAFD